MCPNKSAYRSTASRLHVNVVVSLCSSLPTTVGECRLPPVCCALPVSAQRLDCVCYYSLWGSAWWNGLCKHLLLHQQGGNIICPSAPFLYHTSIIYHYAQRVVWGLVPLQHSSQVSNLKNLKMDIDIKPKWKNVHFSVLSSMFIYKDVKNVVASLGKDVYCRRIFWHKMRESMTRFTQHVVEFNMLEKTFFKQNHHWYKYWGINMT